MIKVMDCEGSKSLISPRSATGAGDGVNDKDIVNNELSKYERGICISKAAFRPTQVFHRLDDKSYLEDPHCDNTTTRAKGDKRLIEIELPPSDIESEIQNNASPSIAEHWYSYETLEYSGCPFQRLHHSGLVTEFLRFPHVHDTRSRHILAGINDMSSGVPDKIQFIVSSLKDCFGIWPQLFLQKLNTIIVRADRRVARDALCKDNFRLVYQITEYYCKETKCCLVFRYWCFLYNAFSRNLIQVLPIDARNKLLAQLQIDFTSATQDSCRCKSETRCTCQCEPDDEHRKVGRIEQMKITGTLIYYLLCKIGNHFNNPSDIFNDTQFSKNSFAEGSLALLYVKLYENSSKVGSNAVAESNLMELLCHLLIAYNSVPCVNSVVVSATQIMLDMGCLSAASAMRNSLGSILEKECFSIQKGPAHRLTFRIPELHVGFTTLGLPGILKAVNDIISGIEYDIFSRQQLPSLMDTVVRTQMCLSDVSGSWNKEYEHNFILCRQLQCTLERKMGLHVSEIRLDSDDDQGSVIENVSPFPLETSESTSDKSGTSQSRLHIPIKATSSGSQDEWIAMTNTRNVSKMRKGYEDEMNLKSNKRGLIGRWISGVFQRIMMCGRSCGSRVDAC